MVYSLGKVEMGGLGSFIPLKPELTE